MNTSYPGPAARRGVTLTELLVVLLIIGLLTTAAIPVYLTHAERSRINTAQVECREIAQAEEYCGAIHGFYVPIQVLDDLPDSQAAGSGSDQNGEQITDENNIWLIDVNSSLALIQSGGTATPGQFSQSNAINNRRVQELFTNWQGPFLTPQRVWSSGNRPDLWDYPLDPWGRPYLLYSPLGVIGSGALNQNDYNNSSFSDGRFTINGYRLMRYAVVSWGPNGTPDDPNNTTNISDDIVYRFGPVIPESRF